MQTFTYPARSGNNSVHYAVLLLTIFPKPFSSSLPWNLFSISRSKAFSHLDFLNPTKIYDALRVATNTTYLTPFPIYTHYTRTSRTRFRSEPLSPRHFSSSYAVAKESERERTAPGARTRERKKRCRRARKFCNSAAARRWIFMGKSRRYRPIDFNFLSLSFTTRISQPACACVRVF